MHSFTGDLATAACVEMGCYISFAGMLTYKNAQAFRDVAARMPLDRVLVETDCPYLAPVPHRGQRGRAAHVVHTGATLAQILDVAVETLAEQTTRHAERYSDWRARALRRFDLELHQLRYFVAVAETGSFTRAADAAWSLSRR